MDTFNFEKYKPIDYRSWVIGDKAREGVNILEVLTEQERMIWQTALRYQDQRNDAGHAEMVTYFALQLIQYYAGDRDVVIPSAILHDIGWYKTDVDEWKKRVSKRDTEGEVVRRPHQSRGAGLAGRVLNEVNFPEQHHLEIFDIIGDHDTRLLPLTPNSKLVWDADMLWRVTYPCSLTLSLEGAREIFEKLEQVGFNLKAPHDLSQVAMQIGRVELVNTLFHRFPEESHALLERRYATELEKIVAFYK